MMSIYDLWDAESNTGGLMGSAPSTYQFDGNLGSSVGLLNTSVAPDWFARTEYEIPDFKADYNLTSPLSTTATPPAADPAPATKPPPAEGSSFSTAVKWVDNKLTSIVGQDTIGKLYAGAILAGATEIGKYLTAKDTNKQAIVKQQADFVQADKTLLANQQYTDKTRQEEWAREDAKNARRWATPVKVRRRSTTAQPTTTV